MNRGLVVNSETLARVWSPLLAIFVLVLFFSGAFGGKRSYAIAESRCSTSRRTGSV